MLCLFELPIQVRRQLFSKVGIGEQPLRHLEVRQSPQRSPDLFELVKLGDALAAFSEVLDNEIELAVTPVDGSVIDEPPRENIGIGTKPLDNDLRALLNAAIRTHAGELERLKATLTPSRNITVSENEGGMAPARRVSPT